MKINRLLVSLVVAAFTVTTALSQSLLNSPGTKSVLYHYIPPTDTIVTDSIPAENKIERVASILKTRPTLQELLAEDEEYENETDDIMFIADDTMTHYVTRPHAPLHSWLFRPVVFDNHKLLDPIPLAPTTYSELPVETDAFYWIEDDEFNHNLIIHARQSFFVNHPDLVIYDEDKLPEPPKKFVATIDPETAKITISEEKTVLNLKDDMTLNVEKRHWLKKFNGDIQFSQAFVSPNWYQGGNNNLNMIINAYYNVKLNPKFHPRWLFETTVQYKLGLNSAPDDSLRNYSISEDLFQANLVAGFRATKGWYYSANVSFKTQFLNNYQTNSRDLKASFLSPGELNVGLGMTYNYANPKKTFTFDASISPLSWNMKTCINRRMNETAFGIKEGRKTVMEYGSSSECKLFWQISHNISYRSRLSVFTDYDYLQGDWENTLSFNINRLLSTQIYAHLRYDSTSPYRDGSSWHKWQLKEILSFGFSYRFSSI